MVQLLPFADEKAIETIERNINGIKPVSAMIDEGMTPSDICKLLLSGLEPEILEERMPVYRCDCSKERVERALLSMGREQLNELITEDHGTEVCCHFCEKKYRYSEDELKCLLNDASK